MAGIELTNVEDRNLWIGEVPTGSSASSASSSSSSSSSSLISSSSSSDGIAGTGASILFDISMTDEERKLTYKEFIAKRVNDFYEDNPNIFDNKTNEEKENIILNIVSEGELLADVVIGIVIREGLDVE